MARHGSTLSVLRPRVACRRGTSSAGLRGTRPGTVPGRVCEEGWGEIVAELLRSTRPGRTVALSCRAGRAGVAASLGRCARLRLSARLVAVGRPPVHVRGAGRCREGRRRRDPLRPRRRARRRRRDRDRRAAGDRDGADRSVLYELPPALVDLALWVADYYGSTPARALELVAPKLRARRGERRMTGAGSPARRSRRS